MKADSCPRRAPLPHQLKLVRRRQVKQVADAVVTDVLPTSSGVEKNVRLIEVYRCAGCGEEFEKVS